MQSALFVLLFFQSPSEGIVVRSVEAVWGDVSFDAQNAPRWTEIPDARWKTISMKRLQSERQGDWLILRFPRPHGDFRDPALYIADIHDAFEVYVDSQIVRRYGTFPQEGASHAFVGYRPHVIPLPSDVRGSHIYIRVFSNRSDKIGPRRSIRFGEHEAFHLKILRESLPEVIVGFFLALVGLFAVFIFATERVGRNYLSFGMFSVVCGVYVLVPADLWTLLFPQWTSACYHIEVLSLFLIPVAFTLFLQHNASGRWKIGFMVLWLMHSAYVLMTAVLLLAGAVHITWFLRPFHGLLILSILTVFTMIGILYYQRQYRSREFLLAIAVIGLAGVHDVLVWFRILPYSFMLFKWSVLVFVVLIGYILERKYANVRIFRMQQRARLVESELRAKLAEAQTQSLRAERMASLGQLAAGIAHEIKNPLNFVDNFSSLTVELLEEFKQRLGRGLEGPSAELLTTIESNLSKIREHGERADAIVKNMLLHARTGPASKSATDINLLVAQYVDLAYHSYRARHEGFAAAITKQLDDGIGEVEVISQDICRVLINLMNNACYAVDEKRKSAPSGYFPELWVRTRNLGSRFEMTLRDNGIGVSDAVIERVLHPFFTTKPPGEGTGLGLSISYDIIVKEHDGTFDISSREGESTEVRITLPKQDKPLNGM